jgi:Ca2+-binding EF-hand superfamily protein
MFDQEQIAEFKEAFNLIDYDHDGFISKNDLEETYNSLGAFEVALPSADSARTDNSFTSIST